MAMHTTTTHVHVHVRPLTPEDVPAATAVWAAAMRSYGKGYIETFVAQKLQEDMHDAYASYVASADNNSFWVAVQRSTATATRTTTATKATKAAPGASGVAGAETRTEGETIVGCVGAIFRPMEEMQLAEPPGKAYLSTIKDAEGQALNSGVNGTASAPLWGALGATGILLHSVLT